MDRRQRALALNARLLRTVKIRVGDYVLVQQQPVRGRAYMLDQHNVGPMRTVSALGTAGVSFLCRYQGQRVTFQAVHASRIKPYTDRPAHLQHSAQHPLIDTDALQALDEAERIDSVVDRRAEGEGAWSYRLRLRDGTLSAWTPEYDVRRHVTAARLDHFHAVFELRHADNMPRRAVRRERAPP